MHAHKIQAYEVQAYDMQVYDMRTSNIHALWVTRPGGPAFVTKYSQEPFLVFQKPRPGDTDPLQHVAVWHQI